MSTRTKVRYAVASAITITSVVVFVFVLMNTVVYSSNDNSSIPVADFAKTDQPTTSNLNNETPNPNLNNLTKKKTTPVAVPNNYPSKILIPKISVNAHIQYVGVNQKGNLSTPSNFFDVAWYKDSAVPGQNGTAIIDGHLDDGLGLPAVFWKLSQLNVGDEIDIITKEGKTLRFEIKKINSYNINDPLIKPAIFSETNTPTLRLVTCEGSWIESQKMYDTRLVVSADLIN